MIIVQHIECQWDKSSRGGAPAELRNAVPEILAIPLKLSKKPPICYVHQVTYSQRNDFQGSSGRVSLDNDLAQTQFGCVHVIPLEVGCEVRFEYDRVCGGAPDRWDRKALLVPPGRWVQVVHNGRFSEGWDSYWVYRKHVVNVGVVDVLRSDLFTDSEPLQRFASIRHLY